MIKKKFVKVAAPLLLGLGAYAASPLANAQVLVDNWIIDFDAACGAAPGTYGTIGTIGGNGVDEITFKALYRAVSQFSGAPDPLAPQLGPTPVAGDRFTTDILGNATTLEGDGGPIVLTSAGSIFNVDVELTFVASTTQEVFTNPAPATGTVDFIHLSPGAGPIPGASALTDDGYLDVYLDYLTGPCAGLGGALGNTNEATGGEGLNDGILIARLQVIPTCIDPPLCTLLPGSLPPSGPPDNFAGSSEAFGSFTPRAFNSDDNALFVLINNTSAETGAAALFRNDGTVLPTDGTVFAETGSDANSDPDNDSTLDTQWPNGPLGGDTCGSTTGGQTNEDLCGTEDGSQKLFESREERFFGFKCYFAKQVTPFDDRVPENTVEIRDQFQPNGVDYTTFLLHELCNSAIKNYDGTLPIPDDVYDEFLTTHRTGYKIRPAESTGLLSYQVDIVTENFGADSFILGRPWELLVPAVKTILPDGVAQGSRDGFHYLCYTASSSPVLETVTIDDQFGREVVIVNMLEQFCTPAGKNESDFVPPVEDPADPETWSHLACYSITELSGPDLPIEVNVVDQFTQPDGVTQTVEAPRQWCEPAYKANVINRLLPRPEPPRPALPQPVLPRPTNPRNP